jgi:hypothetical protein
MRHGMLTWFPGGLPQRFHGLRVSKRNAAWKSKIMKGLNVRLGCPRVKSITDWLQPLPAPR